MKKNFICMYLFLLATLASAVYKRQTYNDFLRMMPTIPIYDENNPGGYGYGDAAKSVSYTHLDVYKRQVANDAFTICRTTTGDVWIGTTSGLLKYNRSTDDFTRIPQLKNRCV